MAKTVSEEEIQLRKRARRRLVGAVTLVVAAIVILPMLLDSKPEERSQEIDIRIPAEDSAEEFDSGAVGSSQATDAATVEKPPTGVRQDEQVTPESSVKPTPSMEPAGKPAGKKTDTKLASERGKSTAATAETTDAFVVQLGAFSNPAKARQQLQNLMSRDSSEYIDSKGGPGAKAYTEAMKVDKGAEKGEVTRVRVGPFRTREQAEETREKLKKLGFEGVVTDK
ncbi:SPOR domain-containing protein [Nitrosovibrio tenuis]|uniref:DedD protein n=1 Tax=Nitrosovibrio tenuis TaxID=1233 RepID=A0A1H7MQF8_9PROT|nr:SPOR domain-containing protein [Nitrosovibrio tenuis]SEL13068.1 DedD protein [Nitrosovibrio tenuis]